MRRPQYSIRTGISLVAISATLLAYLRLLQQSNVFRRGSDLWPGLTEDSCTMGLPLEESTVAFSIRVSAWLLIPVVVLALVFLLRSAPPWLERAVDRWAVRYPEGFDDE